MLKRFVVFTGDKDSLGYIDSSWDIIDEAIQRKKELTSNWKEDYLSVSEKIANSNDKTRWCEIGDMRSSDKKFSLSDIIRQVKRLAIELGGREELRNLIDKLISSEVGDREELKELRNLIDEVISSE